MAVTTKSTAKDEPKKVTLELAFLNRYNRAGVLFLKGQAYTFTADQAEVLLEETDPSQGDRPIFKRWKPKAEIAKAVAEAAAAVPVDMTSEQSVAEPLPENTNPQGNTVELGSEEELNEILGNDAGTAV